MKILSAIISSIWNTITFMDKEQRAVVAHVLTVSQAHPKSFAFRNGAWRSDGMKITYTQAQNNVNLSGVFYKLGWRANSILARHFAMLHICLHHDHIGKALSEIDKVENDTAKKAVDANDNQQTVGDIGQPKPSKKEKQPEWITDIDLTKWIGKTVDVKMRNGDFRNRVKIDSRESLTWNISIGYTSYTQEGRYYDKGADGRDIVAIKLST